MICVKLPQTIHKRSERRLGMVKWSKILACFSRGRFSNFEGRYSQLRSQSRGWRPALCWGNKVTKGLAKPYSRHADHRNVELRQRVVDHLLQVGIQADTLIMRVFRPGK